MPAFTAAFTGAVGVGNAVLAAVGAQTSSLALIAGVGFLTQASAGVALHALTPKPKVSKSAGVRGFQVNAKGTASDRQVIYGEVKRGGLIYDIGNSGGMVNGFLDRVYVHAGHPVDGYTGCYIGDQIVTKWKREDNGEFVDSPADVPNGTTLFPQEVSDIDENGNVSNPSGRYGLGGFNFGGNIRMRFYDGTQTQADAKLMTAQPDWTAQHVGRDLAYVYVQFYHGSGASFPNGIPEVKFVIRGKPVYDPRTGETAFSSNPALCIRDWIYAPWGLNADPGKVDDARVIAAADVCDRIAANGKKWYSCNGAFVTAVQPFDVLANMMTSFAGHVWHAQGKWRMKAGHYTAPTMTLTEADLRSPIAVRTRHSMRENFNTVRGTFAGPETAWQVDDYPQVTDQAFINADGGKEKVQDFDLPFTTDSAEARRIARIFLERNRQQLSVSAVWSLRAMKLQVGDIVRISYPDRFGWLGKEFEVMKWAFVLGDELTPQIQMDLREISESVFDEVADGAVYERDNTTLQSAFYVPPVGINVTSSLRVYNQKVTNVAELAVTASATERIYGVEVQYKPFAESDWIAAGRHELGRVDVVDLAAGFYDFRARAFNGFNIPGEWVVTSNREINPSVAPPGDVTGFARELSGGSVFFNWSASTDLDLSHYIIKHNPNEAGATWGNSTTVIDKVPRPGTSATLPARSGTFLIKAADKEGNQSQNATPLVITSTELPQLGQTQEVIESPDFDGIGTNIEFDTAAIRIDDTSAATPLGEYLFDCNGLGWIDTGSNRAARVTGSYDFGRKFDGAQMLWSDIPGTWSSWPGLWSTWTDEDGPFGDVGVRVLVSATPDDPSGSPVWGPYEPANGAYLNGRAFRFKAVLESQSEKFTPNVTALSVKVEY